MATEAEIKQKYAINIESLVVLHLGSLIGGFLSGVTLPLHVYLRFRNAKRTRTILNEMAKISLFTPRYDTIILNEKYDKTFNIMFDHPFNLPSSISLELKQDLNLPLNSVLDLRSAYMAEFAREWKKEEDRNILVGAAHTPQIKYFLEKGVKDQRIVDLAHEHAALAKDDLDKLVHYHSSPTIKSNKLKQASAKATFYSGMGISLYGVYQLFS